MKGVIWGLVGLVCGAAGAWYGHGFTQAQAAPETPPEMTVEKPAYLVVLGEVYDREAFMSGYSANLRPLYAKYGGEYLAVGRNKDILENGDEFASFVISKWPSMDAARAFWSDPEYEKLKLARIEKGWSEFDVYLLEGLPEAQAE